jgi:two-component system response regulator PilR (NtrC family)
MDPEEGQQNMAEDSRPRILVMEDDPNLSELYAEALGLEGYHVDSARTIAQARSLLAANKYRVFLCDMQIGRDRSTDLLREILDTADKMQVIMLSGLGQYQAEAMAMGVDFFLAKPIEIPDLVALIDRLAK